MSEMQTLGPKEYWQELRPLGLRYVKNLEIEFGKLWKGCKSNSSNFRQLEVFNGILSRQASLVMNLAQEPFLWNNQMVPIIQRCLLEMHINLAWIFIDVPTRTQMFIDYGLGQQKLFVEHLKNIYKDNEQMQAVIDGEEAWLNMQQMSDFTEVNVSGSWSGIDLRNMAQEVGLEDYYKTHYSPLSAAIHSNWHFVAKFNLERCDNVLHRYHLIPVLKWFESDLRSFTSTASMLNRTFELYREKMNLDAEANTSFAQLIIDKNELIKKFNGDDKSEKEI